MKAIINRKPGRISILIPGLALIVTIASLGFWGWMNMHKSVAHVYTASGFGGFVGIDRKAGLNPNGELQPVVVDYQAGRYVEAETKAAAIIEQNKALVLGGSAMNIASRKLSLEARRLASYSAARRHDYTLAKTRFEGLRQAAYETPDHGKQSAMLGEVLPTLEEEGAFQEIVCTSALGDKLEAEAEYKTFMDRYPKSILVHAAVKRIARFHSGNVPKDAEHHWKLAMQIQKASDEAASRDAALCGPECLAELMRRPPSVPPHAGGSGKSKSSLLQSNNESEMSDTRHPIPDTLVLTLAREMQTTGEGTSVSALQKVANKHGLKLKGAMLSQHGLMKQKLPIIGLIAPGHFVLIEAVTPVQVTVWDPDARAVAGDRRKVAGGRKNYTLAEWGKAWNGVALR